MPAVALLTVSPPDQLDEYRILEPLGRGGMGQVFLGHDTLLDRPVAVKFIADADPDPGLRQRFLIEARAAARLQHPNVVAIYRVGEIDGRPYLVSELVRGQSLDRVARPMPGADLLRIGVDLARGLAAAHRRNVLHRDIKPANAILADDGVAKLLDFGLAKLVDAALGPAPAVASGTPIPADSSVDATLPAASGDGAERGACLDGSSDQLTVAGVLLGTPYYMAPEVLRGQPASRRSDVYSLGALLYELVAGRPPMRHVPYLELVHTVGAVDAPLLGEVRPGVDRRLSEVIDRCLARDPAERFASGDAVREALERVMSPRRAAAPEGNPYRGLAAFDAEHRGVFFGRGADERAVLDRLRGEGMVLVAGESGVGKSSLVRAGVAPEVADGALGGIRAWDVIAVVPGRRPAVALAAALADRLCDDAARLTDALVADPATFARRVRRGGHRALLLLIDQLEELVTLAVPEEAEAVARLLGELAVATPGLRVIATARGDFIGRLGEMPGLGPELTRALYLLRPLDAEGLRDAIDGPAEIAGARFEDDALIARLIREADGSLPLLQFALAQLWERRDREAGVLRAAALDAIGGVGGALGRHADAAIAPMLAAERGAARRVLGALVTPGRTRARVGSRELGDDPATATALDRLVRARLVVARGGEAPSYELIHEALIARWETLRDWLDDDAGARAVAARIRRAAEEWDRLGRAPDGLLGARQLAELEALPGDALGAREHALVAASRRAHRRRRVARIGLAIAIPAAIAAVFAATTIVRQRARVDAAGRAAAALDARVGDQVESAREALTRARGLAEQVRGLEGEAFARFDTFDRDGGEALWSQARAIGAERERAYAEAAAAAEAALLLDAGRATSRDLVADVLADRARLARGTGAEAELIARLAIHDLDGSRRAALTAPATLRVISDPPGEPIEVDGVAVDSAVTLVPGLHRVTIGAVVAPVLLAPGEDHTMTIAVPATVPDGFAYVPAGRFLQGSRADDDQRRGFLVNAPLHTVETGGFLIARHETTWAEWIAYLDALPAAERARRRPRSGGAGMSGSVSLDGAPGRWRLRMQPGGVVLEAGWGEPVRYPGRQTRAEQDWRRLPVTGILWEDAAAYAGWLDRTGRVPGARLCDDLEWERAARGADGRVFPHGDTLAPDDANIDMTYGADPSALGPDEVGSHPASRSPFGVDDLAGNVHEWVRSRAPGHAVVARGGNFAFDSQPARTDFRELTDQALRDVGVGMRVCADLSR